MEHEQLVSSTASRDKLGLALAGGGFRASLFHLGVLRRMAELDLLRRVEVLSTVSGGSIVGALYVLLLKRELEAADDGDLRPHQYIGIIDDLEHLLLKGIRKNLRTRLVMNPLGVLRVLLTSHSLGRRMARLYERYLYAEVVGDIVSRSGLDRVLRPGRLGLRELRIRPGGEPMKEGTEAYNAAAVAAGRAVSTRLVLNATSLNSGSRFWFSSSEVGDWYLGHVRHSEIGTLKQRKAWLEGPVTALDRELAEAPGDDEALLRALSLVRWWRSEEKEDPPPGGHWESLFEHGVFQSGLIDTDLGLLRQAKIPAWYLVYGWRRTPPVWGGRNASGHWAALWDAIERIDGRAQPSMEERWREDPDFGSRLLDLLLELYWLRSAEVVSDRVERFWDEASVGDAVGASANFPPVFPPFQVMGLYDDLHVSRLGLTDGGVFDNMGLTALADEGCTQIIASDTSGLFEDQERVSTGRLHMMTRIVSVLQKVVASNQREALRERRRVSRQVEPHAEEDAEWRRFLVSRKLTDLAYFHIDSAPVDPREVSDSYPEAPELLNEDQRRALAGLRTDLDAFGELEIAALVNHGYGMADRYIRRYFGSSGSQGSVWTESWDRAPRTPMPIRVEASVLDRVLAAGGSRFFRALRVHAPLSWIITLVVAAALIWRTWDVRVSARGMVHSLGDALLSALHGMAPWLGAGWTDRLFPVGQVAVAVLLLLLVLPRVTGFSLLDMSETSRTVRGLARRLATVGKWGRSISGNLLWVFGALPIVVSVGASLLAAISDLFFSRPYLRATRNRPDS